MPAFAVSWSALRRRVITADDLVAESGLARVAGEDPGTWTALDDEPMFRIERPVPTGWLRIRFRIHAPARSQMKVFVHGDDSPIGQFNLVHGATEEEFFVHLDRPADSLSVQPLDCSGTFRIDRIEFAPRPAWAVPLDALRRKLRLLRAYRNSGRVLSRGVGLVLTGQWKEVAAKWKLGLDDPRCIHDGFCDPLKAYDRWIEQRRLTNADRCDHRAWSESLVNPPRFSVLMPTFNTPERLLNFAIESVLQQTYPVWELCIADDGSTKSHVRATLEEYASNDPRIKLAPFCKHGGIAAASNAALALATGDYVALLDHDDELAEHALYRMAQAIVADPSIDMLYSDEDKLLSDGRRRHPFFKPDWSPEFFLGCMYTCHLGVYRTSLVRELGGFRSDFDGAQDYDLVLRLTEKTNRIVHVPDILYHWRMAAGSTARGVRAKPQAKLAGMRALDEHLKRTKRAGHTEPGPSPGLNWVRFEVIGRPTISIVIPSLCRPGRRGKPSMLERCVESIASVSRYRQFETIVLDRKTMPADIERRLAEFQIKRLTYDGDFNWSCVNNLGAAHATGDHLLFLNDDTEVVSPDWLEAMLEFSQQPEIGAVGAKLIFPDGALQHVGVTVPTGLPGHPFYGFPGKHTGYFGRAVLPHNCAAVTGACIMTRRDVFARAGGFDESFPLNYNDIDYCLRVRQLGYRIVYTPHAKLIHHESVTKPGVLSGELDAFRARWGAVVDPYYNPNLDPTTFDYRIGE